MRLRILSNRAALAVFLLAMARSVAADAPLLPPADFEVIVDNTRIIGFAAQDQTIVQPWDSPAWFIPTLARNYALGPYRRSILVLGEGGNLVSSRDGKQVVATIWVADGAIARPHDFRLADLMNPDDLPRTTSNYLWLESYGATEGGWRLSLADGRTVLLELP